MQKQTTKRQGEHGDAKKTMSRGLSLREIFVNRKSVFNGLTKFETISEYYHRKLSTVLAYDEKTIKKLWSEIETIKKYLRKKELIAIISKRMPRGFELTDNQFGKRQLEDGEYIYYSCSKIDDAYAYRSKLDKIAKGFFDAGNQVQEITENLDKQRQIIKIVNKQ